MAAARTATGVDLVCDMTAFSNRQIVEMGRLFIPMRRLDLSFRGTPASPEPNDNPAIAGCPIG
jgi:hypothetical protein